MYLTYSSLVTETLLAEFGSSDDVGAAYAYVTYDKQFI